MTIPKNLTLGVIFAIVTGALWGLVFVAPKTVTAFSPLMLVAGRYLVYGLLALGLVLFRLRQILPLLTAKNLAIAFGLAIIGNTLYYLLLTNAILLAGVPIATLIIALMPVTIALVGCLQKGAVPFMRLAPALTLGTAAIALITLDAFGTGLSLGTAGPIIGMVLAMGALLSWTGFAVGNSFFLERHADISSEDWNLIIGLVTGLQGLALMPVALNHAPLPTDTSLWLNFLFVCVAIAFFASLVANALWNRVSRLLPLTLVGPMVLFETLFALLYGFAWEQRLPQFLEIAPMLLMLASVLLSIRAHRTQPRLHTQPA